MCTHLPKQNLRSYINIVKFPEKKVNKTNSENVLVIINCATTVLDELSINYWRKYQKFEKKNPLFE